VNRHLRPVPGEGVAQASRARRAFPTVLFHHAPHMTTQAMGKLLDSYLTELDGQPGFWRGQRDEVPVFVFCDDSHDRMRIMAPIGVLEELDPDLMHVLLQANYDRALDARYAMRGNELWALVVHPLATLATDDLPSLFDQVTLLVKNTGSTFASTELVFRTAPGEDIILETEDDDERHDEGDEDEDEGDEQDDSSSR
jgi:hypothetical protein